MILAKDFIQTSEGLVFAVVETGLEEGKVLCFLRYIWTDSSWKKVNTAQANEFLSTYYPHYLHYSSSKQAHLHGVNVVDIFKHHQAKNRLQQLLSEASSDTVENDLRQLCHLFTQRGIDVDAIGVTGSILISAQTQSSDIDLVFYDRQLFHQVRRIIQQLIKAGDCSELSQQDWQDSYERRDCDLTFDEYVWHEQRKYNKAVINHRKFDLNYVCAEQITALPIQYKKVKKINLKVQISDDTRAFDYPAEYLVDEITIDSIVSYTATYTGQAQTGEWIEVAGQLEQASDGSMRVVVGSSREASGEFIKVVNA